VQQVHRAPWAEFPDVILHTNATKLKAHPRYATSKAGDAAAALEVAETLIRPDKVNLDFDVIVPVIQTDAHKHNALPRAAAFILAIKLNRKALLSVYQTNEVSRTKANAATRILGQPHFAGVVEPGLRVLLLDDVVSRDAMLNLENPARQGRGPARESLDRGRSNNRSPDPPQR
jgi:hypothetical protein